MKGTANHDNTEISKHCNDVTLLCNSMLILKIYWQQCLALKLDDNLPFKSVSMYICKTGITLFKN